MDRETFFKTAFKKILKSGFSLIEDHPVIGYLENISDETEEKKVRPPGAHPSEQQFQDLCTGCDACMSACPVNVIFIEDLEKRYPLLYPEKQPCIHCAGYPCIQACPTQALSLEHGSTLRVLT
jgi:ferredoxin-type protein NapG